MRRSWFAGETFVDLVDARRRAEAWCRTTAGLRVHGTTATRPAQHFPTCPVTEIARRGRTLRAWKTHVLARFDTAQAGAGRISNGGTEACGTG